MPIQVLSFEHALNVSLQKGDAIWVANTDPIAGTIDEPVKLGYVSQLLGEPADRIAVNTDGTVTVTANMFAMFSKPIRINESSVKGYYADVTFENASKTYAELFAISSEIVPSSK